MKNSKRQNQNQEVNNTPVDRTTELQDLREQKRLSQERIAELQAVESKIDEEIAALQSPFQIGNVIEIAEGGKKGRYLVESFAPLRKGDEFHIMGKFYKKDATLGNWAAHINQLDGAVLSEAPVPPPVKEKAPKVEAEPVPEVDLAEVAEAL